MRFAILFILVSALGCGRDVANKAQADADYARMKEQESVAAAELLKKQIKDISSANDAERNAAASEIEDLKKKLAASEARVKYFEELNQQLTKNASKKPEPKPVDPAAMVESAEFIDHVQNFKGKEVEFVFKLPQSYFSYGRESLNTDIPDNTMFELSRHKAKGVMMLNTIKGMPQITRGESLVIRFLCSEGSKDKGNKIISARRATPEDLTDAAKR